MYKLLLCWRYLRSRYLAFVCIGSVMLGVATLIVVNSVMSGFSNKLKDRLHGLLSDVVIETPNYGGFPMKPAEMIAKIEASSVGAYIQAMAPTIEIIAMLQYALPGTGETATRPVHLLGVDPESRTAIGGFAEFLVDPNNRARPSFELPAFMKQRLQGRRRWVQRKQQEEQPLPLDPNEPPPPLPPPSDPIPDHGIIVGYTIASYRNPNAVAESENKDVFLLRPGDDVQIYTVGAAEQVPVSSHFVVRDYFKSEMSEYDGQFVFVPLDYLQRLRGMEGRVTHLQLKLTDYRHAPTVVAELERLFPRPHYYVQTWEDKQGTLLSAIAIERGILNVLLFLIICVAGFSILAIFSMIVFEKTKDIGILKALGASDRGVLAIFVGYGLLLGLIGALLGTVLGMIITEYINEIERFLAQLTGQDIFPRTVYYFDSIPTHLEYWSIVLIDLGAMTIAVLFSILPALRAAWLHPIHALRYD